MKDLFSRTSTKKKEETTDGPVVLELDLSNEPEPEIEVIPKAEGEVEAGNKLIERITEIPTTIAKNAVASADIGLSLGASTFGFMGGALNATVGLVKNLADYSVSGAAKIAAAPLQGMLPEMYDAAEQRFAYDTYSVWSDLTDDFNVVAGAIQYEPQSEYGERFVVGFNDKMEGARKWLGNKAYTAIAPDENGQEVDSLDQLKATDTLQDPLRMKLAAAAGALGESTIDLTLLAVGGLIGKGMRGKGSPNQPIPIEGIGEQTLSLQALDALEGSKPRFKSFEEAKARIEQLASGKARQTIVVETKMGLPIRVISGQDGILALKEVNKRGVQVTGVKVKYVEQSIVQKIDKLAVQKANAAFEGDHAAMAQIAGQIKTGLLQRIATQVTDTAAGVKSSLLKMGRIGELAVRELELTAGATPRAALAQRDAWNRVFKNLSTKNGTGAEIAGRVIETERQLFNEFVRAQRIIAIEKSKLGGKRKVNFEGGATGKDMANWLQAVKDTVGPQKFAELGLRSEALFDTHQVLLKRYLDEGLISQKEYSKMSNFDYLRTEFIDTLDPMVPTKIGGKTIQVGESGIQSIKTGSKKGANLDAEGLMNETIIRAENRIARNRANKRLYDIAVADPKNSVVKIAKKTKSGELADAPPGMDTLRVMVDGKLEGVYMPEHLASQWKMGDPAIAAVTANIARIVSGNALVRPLATGYNPGFVLTNLPRDIVHAWLSTNNIYSTVLPRYLLQLGMDMAVVAKDSLNKTGRYVDYINEGGGMSFLSHQGRDPFAHSGYSLSHRPRLARIRDTLSYINEQSEIMVRLAIRERVLRNQRERGIPLDPVEATWQARRYLDFAQGGSSVKVFDNVVPYLNATVQAYRSVARSAKTSPVEFSAKFMQLAGLYAGWEAYNMLFNPEAHAQIPEKQRRQNFIIHTGEFIIDEDGNKRYEYYQIKKDQSTLPATVWMEQLTDLYITGKPPTDNTLDYIIDSLPGISGVPSINFFHTYLSDHNFWHGEDIFGRDLNVENYAKFKGLPGQPTHEAFKDLGEIFNLKPEALQQATKQVIPNNTFIELATKSYDATFGDADPRMLAATTEERMAKMPFANRVYKLTHPAAVALDEMDRLAKGPNTEEFLRTQKLKDLLFEATRNGDYKGAMDYASAYANEDPFLYKDMMNRIVGTQRLEAIFKDRKKNFDDLPRSWWLGMMSQSSKARAEIYFEEWQGASAERKQFMDSTAGALSSGQLDFIDQEFMFHLSKLKSSRNTDSMDDNE
jgi:hypothetical protein